jgi:hypothetical protein
MTACLRFAPAAMASVRVQSRGTPRSMARTLVLPEASRAISGGASPKALGSRLSTSRMVPSPPSMTSSSTPRAAKARRSTSSASRVAGLTSITSSGAQYSASRPILAWLRGLWTTPTFISATARR